MNKKLIIFFLLHCTQTLLSLEPIMILLGPPGSGKGTCSQFFKENFGYEHLSVGDLINDEIEKKTEAGLALKEAAHLGDVRENKSLVQSIMEKNILLVCSRGKPFIIDGYGKQKEDVAFLYHLLESMKLLDKVFVMFLEVDNSISKERISSRVICKNCHHIYNKITAPEKLIDYCDVCSQPLKYRMDDRPEIIESRMVLYKDEVEHNFLSAFKLYPHFTYNTNRPLEECFQFYTRINKMISEYSGNAREFVYHLQDYLPPNQ